MVRRRDTQTSRTFLRCLLCSTGPPSSLSVLPSFSYRLVSLSGYFDHSRTLFLGPRVRDGTVGAHIVTPFIRDEGGGEVLVDRGFVADTSISEDSNGRRTIKSGAEVSEVGHEAFGRTLRSILIRSPCLLPHR